MNTMNPTITSETDMPENTAVPVQEERPAETIIEEGKTVGKPFADDPKFKLRNVEVFYGQDRAIKNNGHCRQADHVCKIVQGAMSPVKAEPSGPSEELGEVLIGSFGLLAHWAQVPSASIGSSGFGPLLSSRLFWQFWLFRPFSQ